MNFSDILKKEKPAADLTSDQLEDLNQRVEGTAAICHLCKHRGDDPYVCDAYPKGIPISILSGMISHEMPQDGDHGIQFERKSP